MRYVSERPSDPITFAIYPDEKGFASATLYEDDGNSLAYQRRGFRRTKLEVRHVAQAYVVKTSAPEGDYKPGARKFVFLIKPLATARTVSVSDEGTARTIEIRY